VIYVIQPGPSPHVSDQTFTLDELYYFIPRRVAHYWNELVRGYAILLNNNTPYLTLVFVPSCRHDQDLGRLGQGSKSRSVFCQFDGGSNYYTMLLYSQGHKFCEKCVLFLLSTFYLFFRFNQTSTGSMPDPDDYEDSVTGCTVTSVDPDIFFVNMIILSVIDTGTLRFKHSACEA
jgi:hypothetical protein